MSKFESDELDTVGYFLPEEGQLRLKKLREYVEFLSHLAQPRTADETQEWMPEIRAGEVAICLELLAGQLESVLDDISWPANRDEQEISPEVGAKPDDADGRYPFGVTLEQIDTLNRLIGMICAHGDVVLANNDAEFARHTLSSLGDAIFNDATAVREIIHQVESQRPGPTSDPQAGVGEERAIYDARLARLPVDSLAQTTGPQNIERLLQIGGPHRVIAIDRNAKPRTRLMSQDPMHGFDCTSLVNRQGVAA